MKKNDDLNVELNLTSMIDLMSVLVSFLLVTAVWLHISAISTDVEAKGRAPTSTKPPEDNHVAVRVTRAGFQIRWPAVVASGLPSMVRKQQDGYAMEELSEIMGRAVQKKAGLTASVTGDDRVDYGAVAEAIDAVKAGGLNDVSLATN